MKLSDLRVAVRRDYRGNEDRLGYRELTAADLLGDEELLERIAGVLQMPWYGLNGPDSHRAARDIVAALLPPIED